MARVEGVKPSENVYATAGAAPDRPDSIFHAKGALHFPWPEYSEAAHALPRPASGKRAGKDFHLRAFSPLDAP